MTPSSHSEALYVVSPPSPQGDRHRSSTEGPQPCARWVSPLPWTLTVGGKITALSLGRSSSRGGGFASGSGILGVDAKARNRYCGRRDRHGRPHTCRLRRRLSGQTVSAHPADGAARGERRSFPQSRARPGNRGDRGDEEGESPPGIRLRRLPDDLPDRRRPLQLGSGRRNQRLWKQGDGEAPPCAGLPAGLRRRAAWRRSASSAERQASCGLAIAR